jgi:hypothetical protein
VAVIDGMEFPIDADSIRDMKKFAIGIAVDSVVYALAQALTALGMTEEMAAAAAKTMRETAEEQAREAVQQVQAGEAGRGVSSVVEGGPTVLLSGVQESAESGPSPAPPAERDRSEAAQQVDAGGATGDEGDSTLDWSEAD